MRNLTAETPLSDVASSTGTRDGHADNTLPLGEVYAIQAANQIRREFVAPSEVQPRHASRTRRGNRVQLTKECAERPYLDQPTPEEIKTWWKELTEGGGWGGDGKGKQPGTGDCG